MMMLSNYHNLFESSSIPGGPTVSINLLSKQLVHLYPSLDNSKNLISTSFIPWRLHLQAQLLSEFEAQVFLYKAVRLFEGIFSKNKIPFLVNDKMIGLNHKGEVQVWWNQNFSNNILLVGDQITQYKMVQSIFNAILGHAEQTQRQKIKKDLKNLGNLTFENSLKYLEQYLMNMKGEDLSKSMAIFFQLLYTNKQYLEASKLMEKYLKNELHKKPLQRFSSLTEAKEPNRLITTFSNNGFLQFSPKRKREVITKRRFDERTSPRHEDKMRLIQQDIINLRQVANKDKPLERSTLERSRSVGSLYSYPQPSKPLQKIFNPESCIRKHQEVSHKVCKNCHICSELSQRKQSIILNQSSIMKGSRLTNECSVCHQVIQKRQHSLSVSRLSPQKIGNLNLNLNIQTSRSLILSRLDFSPERSRNGESFLSTLKKQKSQEKLSNHTYFSSVLSESKMQ